MTKKWMSSFRNWGAMQRRTRPRLCPRGTNPRQECQVEWSGEWLFTEMGKMVAELVWGRGTDHQASVGRHPLTLSDGVQ